VLNPRLDEALTLRQGLAQFRRTAGLEEKLARVSPQARTLMDRHDVLHVLFGLDTSLRHEAIVDLWTVFGTTARLADLIAYLRLPEEQAILAEIGFWRILLTTLRAAPDLFRVAAAARKLKRKWPWDGHRAHLDTPLGQLRRAYGITLLA
jgi:hypothetical protein